MKQPYLLECCVDSATSAICAKAGGADRLELCADLVIGGTSPSPALLAQVKTYTELPVYPLIRPRFGDFLYSELEYELMRSQISMLKEQGADGFVLGALLPDGRLDQEGLASLIALCGDLPITLHRAFDMCSDPMQALEDARALGISTILTSGQQNTALEGLPLLQALCEQAHFDKSRPIRIMAGAGIHADTISILLQKTSLTAFHMSGKKVLNSNMQYRNPHVSMGAASLDEYALWQTDEAEIKKAKALLNASARS